MKIDFTPLFRRRFHNIARRTQRWAGHVKEIQTAELIKLLKKSRDTLYGKDHDFKDILTSDDVYESFSRKVPLVAYEDIRPLVMRMIEGEKDLLWPGICRDYAQSSGTSGGKSKYIPITGDSLQGNHYRGGEDAVAHYMLHHPESKIFSGKGFILGGSFSNTLGLEGVRTKVGDLSATLINKITPLAEFVRVPDKQTALMSDWAEKLPRLVDKSLKENITNISGVPSWFLTVLRKTLEKKGVTTLAEVWPNLEVFFHGGISFEPYREEYAEITKGLRMHFVETYNASEGFFAVQDDPDDRAMLLILDRNIFYEFIPAGDSKAEAVPAWKVEEGKIYEMVITASNGLWRYRLGDTVRIVRKDPVKIKIAGRTGSFINAFGEEVMEDNAEKAIAMACDACGVHILNYTAAPVYAKKGRKGRHQWLIEWEKEPHDAGLFATELDKALRSLNSDYDAKRSDSIFLGLPEIVSAKSGLFDEWLRQAGSQKLGGQRKVPRLSNGRELIEALLEINGRLQTSKAEDKKGDLK